MSKRYQKTLLLINSIGSRSPSPSPPSSPPPNSVCDEFDSDGEHESVKYDFRYRNEMTVIAGKPYEKLIAIPMPKEVRPSTPPISSSTTVMSYKQVTKNNYSLKKLQIILLSRDRNLKIIYLFIYFFFEYFLN
jgi:hypothetical protein